MSSIVSTAEQFFEACETGVGWEGCSQHCHPDTSFSCQPGALGEVRTTHVYVDSVKSWQGPMPGIGHALRQVGWA